MTWIAVALGGALGSMARHYLSLEIAQRLGRASPWATFAVNIVGCVCVGALAGRIASGHWQPDPWVRTFVFVGVLGGFTTFSAFGLDVHPRPWWRSDVGVLERRGPGGAWRRRRLARFLLGSTHRIDAEWAPVATVHVTEVRA
jgi:protein CrcB